MTDLSPVIPEDCDNILIEERFINNGVEFTGTQYKFYFKKRFNLLGFKLNRTLKIDIVRSDLFLRVEDIELSGKPSLKEFESFVKGWKQEHKEIDGKWSIVDHHYTKIE